MCETQPTVSDAGDRVNELIRIFGDANASAAGLLCDRHDPDDIAYRVVSPDLTSVDLTYGQLRERSSRVAAALSALDVGHGDRVATLMGKSVEYLITVMAIWRLGAVHVPLFTAFAPPAIAFRLTRSGTKFVVCDAAQQAKLAPSDDMPADARWRVIATGPQDALPANALPFADLLAKPAPDFRAAALGGDAPIIEIYTSGTTGRPKGVVVPLRALAGFQAYAEFALDLRQDDVFWNAADPGWGYGLYFGVLAALSTGVTGLLLEGGFTPESTFAVLSHFGVTNFAAAPTVYRSLRVSGAVPASGLRLRCLSSAGEPLTPEVNVWATNALGHAVRDHYGQTEAGMLINNHHRSALLRPLREGSMGHAAPGWKVVVIQHASDDLAPVGEVGRIAVEIAKSPLAWFNGYVDDAAKSAEKFSADGRYYLTGDVGRMDEDGYLYFSSRDDDVIIMAGYRIGPFDVESVLATHSAVSECAVVAVPDEIRGEVLTAVVALREGQSGSPALTKELQDWVKSRFAAHAYPREIHYVKTLPKTPSGKIQRFILREQLKPDAETKA